MRHTIRNRQTLIIEHILHMKYLIRLVRHPVNVNGYLLNIFGVHFELQYWVNRFDEVVIGVLCCFEAVVATVWLICFLFGYFQSFFVF